MKTYLLDASALMAFIRSENGADVVEARLNDAAAMSSVNVSEAIMRSVEKGFSADLVTRLLVSEQVQIFDFGFELARTTAALRPATKHLGLSFADRACIATAIRLGAIIVTADRAWSTLELPCSVELIR